MALIILVQVQPYVGPPGIAGRLVAPHFVDGDLTAAAEPVCESMRHFIRIIQRRAILVHARCNGGKNEFIRGDRDAAVHKVLIPALQSV